MRQNSDRCGRQEGEGCGSHMDLHTLSTHTLLPGGVGNEAGQEVGLNHKEKEKKTGRIIMNELSFSSALGTEKPCSFGIFKKIL